MKKAILGLALLGLASSAQAVENTFTFDVLSSGPDIYACNAGIKHVNPQGQVGYDVNDSVTRTNDQGDYLQDVMMFSLKKYDQWTDTATNYVSSKRVRANGSDDWTTATGFSGMRSGNLNAHKDGFGTADEKSIVLADLTYELSSERYGTEYFVDVCYYGPRFHAGAVGTHFVTDAEVTFTNLWFKNYREKSNLLVKAKLVCDGVLKKSTNWQSANVSFRSFWNNSSIGGAAYDKCVFRYSFKENTTEMRANIKHGAQVKVRSEITDPTGL